MSTRYLWLFPLTMLPSCGIIPIQTRDLSDFTIAITAPDQVSTQPSNAVGYLPDAQITQSVPFLKIRISATLTYKSTHNQPIRLRFYTRAGSPQDCPKLSSYYICSSEPDHRRVGEITVFPDVAQSITLEGPELDQAVHSGLGYLGLQLVDGTAYSTDRLEFKEVRALALL